MEYFFNVNLGRFHFTDKQKFVLEGWFPQDNPEKNEIQIFLDQTALAFTVEKFTDLFVRKKYLGLNQKVGEEYFLTVELPKELSRYKKLAVYTVNPGEPGVRHLSFDLPVKRMLEKQKEPEYCIDRVTVDEENGCTTIQGWAASREPLKVSVLGADGRELESKISFSPRSDVAFSFHEAEQLGDCGFLITVPVAKAGQTLVLRDGELEARCRIKETKEGDSRLALVREYWNKGMVYLRHNGVKQTFRKTVKKLQEERLKGNMSYEKWRGRHCPDAEELERQRNTTFTHKIKFSIVVPLYRTPENYLLELVDSVRAQTYPDWELCLSDGSGADSPLTGLLNRLAGEDKRIRPIHNGEQLRISENTNRAIVQASGDFLVFADHDDLLPPEALFFCAKELEEHPETEIIYTDEDKVSMNGKRYFQPHFKSDFNPDLLCSMNYINHLFVVKRSLQKEAGLLNAEYDGAQDYDFVFRCTERTDHIRHIPRVLYHWRSHDQSTAEDPESKLYAFEAGARAIRAHYGRLGIPARVEQGEYYGLYRSYYETPGDPLISILIPNKDHIEDLKKCMASVERCRYTNYEFVIIENNSTEQETFDFYRELEQTDPRVRMVYYKGAFNYADINNTGAKAARGEYLLLLNNDTEMIRDDCLSELLGYCMRPDVGIVGARLYYGDDTIQHAGVVLGYGGIAGHTFIGMDRRDNGYFSRIICAQDYSAVTAACMMVKKAVFDQVGGMTTELAVAFNDIDFCMKARAAGYLVVYNPYAELYHYESKSRGLEDTPEKIERFNKEVALFCSRWKEQMDAGDPYYNPNLTLDKADFSIGL